MIRVLTKLLDKPRQAIHPLLAVAALLISTSTIAGEVLFVSDSVTDAENIPSVLSGGTPEVTLPSGAGFRPALDGNFHNVTIVRDDYDVTGGTFGLAEGTNPALGGDLGDYCAVFWSASGPHEPLGLPPGTGLGADGGLHTDAAVFTNLMDYVQAGGFVFVTGHDAIAHPHDALLVEFVGGSAPPPASAGQQLGPTYGPVAGPPGATAITNGSQAVTGLTPLGGGVNQVDGVQEQDYLVRGGDPNVTVLVEDFAPGLVPAAAGWTVRHPFGTADDFSKGHIAYVANGVFFYETEPAGVLETLSDGEDPSWFLAPYNGALRNFADTACAPPPPEKCDLDGDSDIDRADIMVLFGLRGTTSPPSPSTADLDDNGLITINDARGCVLRCTRPSCATE